MKKHDRKVLFSSKSDEHATPQSLFDVLNKEFAFTLDPAATEENHKCAKYYTMEDDGLSQSWAKERVFVNPPYSNVKGWVEKAYKESQENYAKVVMLLPSRTDTRWFHDYCMRSREIRFIKGRLKFGDAKNSAPFPSMIVCFSPGFNTAGPQISTTLRNQDAKKNKEKGSSEEGSKSSKA